MWGENPATDSWNFGTSGNTYWTAVTNGTSYCGGWGCKGTTTSYVVRTTNNISDFTTILTNASYSNFSLKVTVKGVCNSGTNKCMVTLLNSSNNKVGTLEQTINNGFGSGSNASSAKDVEFSFTPTSTVARIQVTGYNKTAITQVRYSLSYTSGPTLYTVTYDANGGSVTPASATQASAGAAITTPTPTRTGYTCSGWYTAISDGTKRCNAGGSYTPTATETIHAQWTPNNYSVNWVVNGNDWTGSTHGSPSTNANYDTKPATIPTAPTSSACDGNKVFVGWTKTPIDGTTNTVPSDIFTIQSNSPTITGNTTFYAVFATTGTATFNAADITATPETGNTLEWEHTASGTLLKLSAGQRYTGGTPNTWTVTKGTSNYARFTAGMGKSIIKIVATLSGTDYKINSVTKGTLSTSSTTQTIVDIKSNTIDCKATSGYQIRITTVDVIYGSAFATSCCTALAQVEGSVTLSNADCDAGELKATWKTNSEGIAGIASQVLHVYKASDDSEVTAKKITGITASTEKKTQTISGLDNCTEYYVRVENISAGGSFCGDGWAGDPSSSVTTKGYTYGITKTNVTLKQGADEEANTCAGNFSAQYVANAGYELPASLTVTGASTHTWSVSEGVGTLTINAANVTGNVSTTIAGTCITPNITVHPASAVYSLNESATPLSVTVEGAGDWCGYQWQSKVGTGAWTDIPSATNSSYTPSTASAGTTTDYRVIVSNIASGCSSVSTSEVATISVSDLPVCASPTFSEAAGTKLGAQSITLSCEDGDATIYYTTNGDDPQEIAADLYDGSAIAVNQTTTIKAIAAKSGTTTSAVVSAIYTIQCKAPTANVSAGTYNVEKSVELSSEYGTVYYTTDGSDPASGTAYNGAIAVSQTTTIRAIAKRANCENSEEFSATYTLKCATPTFSVAAGTHTGAQDVELSCATDGAAIHYTTNGNDPTGSSPTYSEAITVSSAQTIKAIATKSGWSNSDIATAAYTIQYAVKWYVGGTEEANVVQTTYVTAGSKVAPIADRDGDAIGTCATDFMGWTTSALRNGSVPQTADHYTTLFKNANASASLPTISEATSYYAVFAKEGTGKVTVTDELTRATTGVTDGSTSYTTWSDKTAISDAVYAGQSAGGNNSIQLRSDHSNSGVITTTSGGKAKKVTVEWNSNTTSGRTINIYGKNSAYSAASDLYDNNNQGTLLGTIIEGTSTELTITGDYEYIGIRSSSGALYLDKVDIQWETTGTTLTDYVTECAAVAAPILNVEGGTYNEVQTVKISNYDGDFRYFYTTDGSDPAADTNLDPTGNSVAYNNTTGILIDKSCTLKVIGYNEGLEYSEINTVDYVLQVPAVTFDVPAGTYNTGAQTVTLSSIDGATIYYTTDGADPTTESDVYNSAITVDANKTIKAFATKTGWTASEIATAAYVINYPRTVTFDAGTGTAGEESLTEASYGAGITLPSATPSTYCVAEGWEFAGWATSNSTSVAPTLKEGDNYDCAASTLYAVYKNGDSKYHLVTELPTGEDIPGTYVIVNTNGKVALEAAVKNTNYLYGCAISSITNGVINPADINAEYRAKSVWQVTYESSKWIFYNANTGKYLYNYAISTNHYVGITSTKPSGYTLTLNNTGFTVFTSDDDNGKHINWASSYSNFAQGEDENIHLYKLDETYSSTPVCCDDEVTVSKADNPSTGTFTINKSGVLSTCAGSQVVTVTCTPNPGYHVDEVTETIGTGVTIRKTEENVYTVTYDKNVSGTSTISVTFAETLTPNFQISETAFEIGDVAVGATVQRQFNISAAHLEGTSLSITSSNDKFTVSPTSLTIKADGSVDEATIKVTLNTTAVGGPYSATITLADEATTPNTTTVSLTNATIKNQYNVKWYNGTDLLSEANYLDGATISFIPTAASCDQSISHVGWLPNATIDGKQADAPAGLVANEDIPAVTADVEYHAVFAKVGEASWRNTALADLTSEDIFVIAETTGSYALSSANGTSEAPTATSITIENNKITSEVVEALKWNVSGSATNGYTFYPNGSTTTWLYCTNTNNGVRVGDNANKVFEIKDGYLYHKGTSRYVGIYNSQDWRCYTSTSTNINDQSFAYFKYIAPETKDYMTTCAVTFTATYEAGAGSGDDYVVNNIAKNGSHTVLGNNVTGFTKDGYRFTGWKDGSTDRAVGYIYEDVTADLTLVAQWTEKEDAGLEYAQASYDVMKNGTFTKPTLTNPNDLAVTYSSSNESVATVDAEGNVTLVADATGEAIITASSAATESYKAGEASYTLLVAEKWAMTYTSNLNVDENDYTIIINGTTYANQSHRYGTGSVAGVATINVPKNTQKLHFHAAGWKNETVALKIEMGSTLLMTINALVSEEHISGSDKTYTLTGKTSTDEYYCLDLSSYPITANTAIKFTATAGKRFLLYGVNEEGGIFEITSNTDISDMPENVNIEVKNGKTLTVDENRTLDNLTVEAGGKVDGSGKLTVNDFTIEGQDGKSGQVMNAHKLTINGDAYFDFTLAVSGTTAANQWHNFSVPFPVSVMDGVYNAETGAKLTNEVDYAIEDYHGDLRAQGKYGWKKYRGIMQPGITYSMTVNGDIQTFRFKKVAGAYSFDANPSVGFSQYTSGENTNAGWNGLGNMRLCYASVNNENIKENNGVRYVQILDATEYAYKSYTVEEINLTVGSAFFIQAANNGTMTFAAAHNAPNIVYAPARTEAKRTDKPIAVTLSNENQSDRMYITASEDAKSEYQIGCDLQKMFATNTPQAPMIYSVNYGGIKLAAEEAPIVNDKASYALSLYAPANGTYRIETPTESDNADLYLTKDGRVIWNLSMNGYEVELTKGTTEGYGLLLVRKAPSVATGVDEPTSDSSLKGRATKVVIDEHVYILRDGQMYDVTGKAVK